MYMNASKENESHKPIALERVNQGHQEEGFFCSGFDKKKRIGSKKEAILGKDHVNTSRVFMMGLVMGS